MKLLDDDKFELVDVLAYSRDMLVDITDQLDEVYYGKDDIKEIYEDALKVCEEDKCKIGGECTCIIDSNHINTVFQEYNQTIYEIVDKINPSINRILKDHREHWDAYQKIEARKIEGKYGNFLNYEED